MKPEEETNFYKPDEAAAEDAAGPPDKPEKTTVSRAAITWTASEYIEHQHNAGWYSLLVLITALLAGATYLMTKDYFATGTIVVAGIIIGVSVSHKPKQIEFEISADGLRAGKKTYGYNLFKSFGIMKEGNLTSLHLNPVRRFMPPVSAFFDPKDQEKVTNALGNYLPYGEHRPSAVDRLSFRLRI